mmetsp:Transcript_109046/g.171898  ORF Transcript_109046/g.171898 Transcript_109046/m.171898 type:complete len:208 (+) Transcript_109046:94-717(+)
MSSANCNAMDEDAAMAAPPPVIVRMNCVISSAGGTRLSAEFCMACAIIGSRTYVVFAIAAKPPRPVLIHASCSSGAMAAKGFCWSIFCSTSKLTLLTVSATIVDWLAVFMASSVACEAASTAAFCILLISARTFLDTPFNLKWISRVMPLSANCSNDLFPEITTCIFRRRGMLTFLSKLSISNSPQLSFGASLTATMGFITVIACDV